MCLECLKFVQILFCLWSGLLFYFIFPSPLSCATGASESKARVGGLGGRPVFVPAKDVGMQRQDQARTSLGLYWPTRSLNHERSGHLEA